MKVYRIENSQKPVAYLYISLKMNIWKLKLKSTISFIITPQKWNTGLPWWRSGWESACQCRGHGFEPWSGRIPHATEQLGPWATVTEPARLEPMLRNRRGHSGERPAHCDEERPPLAATRESPRTETKTQHSQKNKIINKLKKKKKNEIHLKKKKWNT